VAAAFIAALIVAIVLLHLVFRLDEALPYELHRKVRHAAVLLPQ